MIDFEFHSPTKFVFGKSSEQQLTALLKECAASKILIHYGSNFAAKSGLLQKLIQNITNAGFAFVRLGGVEANPKSSLVYEGVQICKREAVDFILAIGGGSVIDSAKAISLGAANDCDFWDFFLQNSMPQKRIPLGVVLTIPASGSEGSTSSVITHEVDNLKRGFNHQFNRPVFAIMNPALTYTLPAYQTACGIVDIMSHVLERYMTQTVGVSLTDHLCEGILLALVHNSVLVMNDPCNYDARANIMWAGTLAHNHLVGLGREGDWCAHQLEHELSALYGVAHGAGLAVILPAYMKYQYKHNVPLFAQLANRVFGVPYDRDNLEASALEGIQRLEQFFKSLGMPVTMAEIGAKKEDIANLAAKVKVNAQGFSSAFHPITKEDFEKIYLLAWGI